MYNVFVKLIERIYFVALCSVAAMLTCFALSLFNHDNFSDFILSDPLHLIDFKQYYLCGKLALSPDRFHAYDPAIQRLYFINLFGPGSDKHFNITHYPPFVFPFCLLIASLPFHISFLLAMLIFFLFLILSIYLASRTFCPPPTKFFLLLVGLISSVPAWFCFELGQTCAFTVFLFVLYFLALKSNRNVLAGITLALSTIRPQYSLFLAIPALVGQRYKILLWSVITEIIMTCLAALVIGPTNILSYPSFCLQTDLGRTAVAPIMVNIRGFLLQFHLLPPSTAFILNAVCMLLSLGWLGYLWHKYSRYPAAEPWLISLTCITALIFSVHTHLYDCMLLIVPATITQAPLALSELLQPKSVTLRVWHYLLLLFPLLSWLPVILAWLGKLGLPFVFRLPFVLLPFIFLTLPPLFFVLMLLLMLAAVAQIKSKQFSIIDAES